MREGRVHWAEAVQRARTVADESLGRWPCCGNDPFVTQVTQIGFEPQEPGRGALLRGERAKGFLVAHGPLQSAWRGQAAHHS